MCACARRRLYHSPSRSTTLIGTIVLLGLTLASPAWADYRRTGPMTGTVCTFGLVCQSNVTIVAVKEQDRFYEVTETFQAVDDYNARTQTCHIRLSRGIWTPLNWLTKTPDFYTQEDGKFKKVEPESVRFKCKKRG